jgi:hypothetical protein
VLDALLIGQSLLVGTVLVAAALAKVGDRNAAATVGHTAAGRLLRRPRVLWTAWYGLAAVEFAVGAGAIARFGGRWSSAAAALLMAATIPYAVWAMRTAPDAPCGCLGSASHAPVSRLTVARNTIICVLAVLAALSDGRWAPLEGHSSIAVPLAAEALVLALMFPELRGRIAAASRRSDCATASISSNDSLAALQTQRLWKAAEPHLRAPHPYDHWRQACWRYFAFDASYTGTPAVAVFAVYLGRNDKLNSVAFVHQTEDRILGHINSATLPSRRLAGMHAGRAAATAAGGLLTATVVSIFVAGCASGATASPDMLHSHTAASYPKAIYPPPKRPRHHWGLAGKCASTRNVMPPGPHTRRRVVHTLRHLSGHVAHDRRYADRAYWPELPEEKGRALGRGPRHSQSVRVSPASRSGYAGLVRNNCGARIVRRSVRVQVAPPDVKLHRLSGALTGEYWLIQRRGRWMVWFTYP